ncbi:MAG: carbohydrate binding domain-containing protein [Dehalococcoidia bacterium]
MTLANRVRTLLAFTTDRGAFLFPRTGFEWETAQPFTVPMTQLVGASYGHDYLGAGAAPKQPASETVRFLVTGNESWSSESWGAWDWGGEGLPAPGRMDYIRQVIARGWGQLWAQTADGFRLWAWARAVAMPDMRTSRLNVAGAVPVVLAFRRQSDWYAEDETAITVAITPSAQDSILPNGDFEDGVDGWLGDGGAITHQTVGARSGSGAMDVSVTVSANQAGARTPDIPCEPATPYTARGWMLGLGDTPTCHLLIAQYDAAFIFLGTVSSGGVLLSTTEWTEAVVAFTSHASAAYVRVFMVTFGAQTAEFRVDDVTLNPNAQTVAFPVTNPGNAPVHNAVVTLAGTVLEPTIRNLTTGDEVGSTFAGVSPDDVLRLDAGRVAVEVSDDGGETWADAYEDAVLGDTQLGIVTLAPGQNDFEVEVGDEPDAEFRMTFHAAYQ